jgi:hypothetical protein
MIYAVLNLLAFTSAVNINTRNVFIVVIGINAMTMLDPFIFLMRESFILWKRLRLALSMFSTWELTFMNLLKPRLLGY